LHHGLADIIFAKLLALTSMLQVESLKHLTSNGTRGSEIVIVINQSREDDLVNSRLWSHSSFI